MTKIAQFVKLDIVTAMPFVNIKLLIGIMVISAFLLALCCGGRFCSLIISAFMVLSMPIVRAPFEASAKNSLNALYSSLGIKRSTVVLGRYIFTLASMLAFCIVGIGLNLGIVAIFQPCICHIDFLFIMALFAYLMFTLGFAISIPYFFKHSYTKGKFFANLPIFLVIPMVVIFHDWGEGGHIVLRNVSQNIAGTREIVIASPVLIALAIAVWIVVMAISFTLSLRIYTKRDF